MPLAKSVILLSLCLYSLTLAISSKSYDSRGVPSDVKYIKCETCAQIAKAAAEKATELDTKGVTELQMFDLVESLCDPGSPNGRWMRTIDLVERVGKLRLEPQDGEQACKRECRTMGLACNAILDGYETELGEKLYALQKLGEVDVKGVESWLCEKKKGVSGACDVKPPLLPRDREKGPEFVKKDPKQVDMDNLMEQMRAMNGGKDLNMDMFNKEQLSGGMQDVDDDDDDDFDEDEDEDEDEDDEDDLREDAKEGDNGEPSFGEAAEVAGKEGLEDLEVGADLSKKVIPETVSDEL